MDKKDKKFIYGLETEHRLVPPFKDTLSNQQYQLSCLEILKEVEHLYNGFSPKYGGRFCIDRNMIEASTPECKNIKDLIFWHLVQEKTLQKILVEFQKKVKYAALFKENTDHHGHSMGSHENYFIPYEYAGVFGARPNDSELLCNFFGIISPFVIPFLVVRPLICGAGKISNEIPLFFIKQTQEILDHKKTLDELPLVKIRQKRLEKIFSKEYVFQITQRADYMERLESPDSITGRGLLHSKFEPLGNNGFRLHLLCGESNRCPISLFLKMGSMSLVLETMFNKGFDSLLPKLHFSPESFNYSGYAFGYQVPKNHILSDRKNMESNSFRATFRLIENLEKPIIDLIRISRHPNLDVFLKLENGRRIHPLEIHEYYLEKTKEYLEKTNQFGGWKKEVWMLWRQVISSLKIKDFKSLIGIVDWITLKHTIDAICQRKGLNYGDAYIRKLETSYFDLYPDPERSLFEWLKNRGKIQMMFEEDEIEQNRKDKLMDRPALRSLILRKIEQVKNKYKERIYVSHAAASWECIHIQLKIFYNIDEPKILPSSFRHEDNDIMINFYRINCDDHIAVKIEVKMDNPLEMSVSSPSIMQFLEFLDNI